jgi:hypothetical protein
MVEDDDLDAVLEEARPSGATAALTGKSGYLRIGQESALPSVRRSS